MKRNNTGWKGILATVNLFVNTLIGSKVKEARRSVIQVTWGSKVHQGKYKVHVYETTETQFCFSWLEGIFGVAWTVWQK